PWLQILITSQLGPADGPGVEADAWIEVEPLPEEDAARLLGNWQRTGQFADAAEREASRRLARELGGFTLAVELAAVFLTEFPDAGCAALLDLLAAEGLEGIESASKGMERGLSIHEERKITATLWPVLERLRPDERRTLELASLMPADAVVWEWVESLVADDYDEVAMAERPWVVGRWTAIRKRLEGMRLLTPDRAWSGRMHALVQEAIRLRGGFDEEASRRSLIEYAFARCAALETDWDNREGDWEIEALHRWSLHLTERDELKGGALEGRAADLLRNLGRYREEEPLRRHVLRVLEAWLGPEDEKTSLAVFSLARNLELLGRFDEALLLYQRAFAWRLRTAEEMDPPRLKCMGGMGRAHHGLGNLAEAETLLRRALETQEVVLGAEHPDTLTSVNNLAELLRSKGDFDAAEPLCRRALDASERVLGREDPDTLLSVNNLALLLGDKGDYDAAEPLYRRALEAQERVLGREHPSTLTSMNNLAELLRCKDDYEAAEPLSRRALEASERVLGREHPVTLGSVNNLAALLHSKGDYEAAEPLSRRALEASERVLSGEHAVTLLSVNNLAALLYRKGDYAAAEPLYRRAAESAGRILGPNHPHTKLFAENHASCLATMRAESTP
ncbi:MAG: tetratricopeptide repeat protein, partial [Bryobacteraceae bacterium]